MEWMLSVLFHTHPIQDIFHLPETQRHDAVQLNPQRQGGAQHPKDLLQVAPKSCPGIIQKAGAHQGQNFQNNLVAPASTCQCLGSGLVYFARNQSMEINHTPWLKYKNTFAQVKNRTCNYQTYLLFSEPLVIVNGSCAGQCDYSSAEEVFHVPHTAPSVWEISPGLYVQTTSKLE